VPTPATLTPAALSTVAHVVVASVDHPVLSAHDHHHVTRVLRARTGEALSVTDGQGAWRACMVPPDWTDAAVEVIPTSELVQLPKRRLLCVAVSLVKGDKPEFVVQKLTEAGIDRIVFLRAAHSVVKWDDDRAAKHLLRLNLVAREALMQSRGVWLPTIEGPVSPGVFVASEQAVGRQSASAQFGGGPIKSDIDTILIGPEGGWSAQEHDLCARKVSLGDQIYRAETAAMAAAVLLSAARSGLVSNG
jgi:16S rRNA (uracil1498-N3)-methyltransferase